MGLTEFRKIYGKKCTERFHIGPSDGGLCQCKLEEQKDVTVTPDPIITVTPELNEEEN